MRIVSLCPSNTEILFALGLGEQVVGADDWSDWPDTLGDLPRVGGDLNTDVDRVAALRPDLVLASLSVPGMERNIEALTSRGLSFLVLNPHSVDDVLVDIVTVGEACGVPDRARSLVGELRTRIDSVRDRCRTGPKPQGPMSDVRRPMSNGSDRGLRTPDLGRRKRLYWEWWPKPLIAAGRASWVHQMTEWVGGENVFADIEQPSRPVSDDEVIGRDPDVLMICWCGTLQRLQDPSRVVSRAGWDRIAAVRSGAVHCVPEALFGRPSQHLVDGLEMLEQLVDCHA